MRVTIVVLSICLTTLALAGCGGGEPQSAADQHEGEGGGEAHGDPAAAADAQASFEGAPPVGAHAVCPVSHEAFTVTAETPTSEHEGRTYAFCCGNCKARFDANPAQFVAPSTPAAP